MVFNLPSENPLALGATLRRSVEASGLGCFGRLAVPVLLLLSVFGTVIALAADLRAMERAAFLGISALFGILCLVIYRRRRKA